MTNRFMRIATVIEMTGKSRSAIYADIVNGCFPKSIPIGKRSVAWAESDIAAWVKSKIDAAKQKPKTKKEKEWDEFYKQAAAEAAANKPYELRVEDI